MLKLLIENDANINAVQKRTNESALIRAISRGIRFLIQKKHLKVVGIFFV